METFIKVTEIWVPNKDYSRLVLKNGIYDGFQGFKAISEQKEFAYQQGLVGATWALARPIIITNFNNSYFERTEEAHKAGLSCAIGLPIFSGEFLTAVIIFLCGGDENNAGAIEIWANEIERGNELGVIDGYYGFMEYFEFVSRKTKIPKGFGLPGLIWEQEMPILMDDLGNSSSFIRGRDAKNAGISTALGIPLALDQEQMYIMTFLSAKRTPIARGLQIWSPDEARQKLLLQDSFNRPNDNLSSYFQPQSFAKGEGLLGKVWFSGTPMIGEINSDGGVVNISVLAIPVIDKGVLKAIVCFIF